MRYINKWKREVVIPTYEMNGVQVPEQHLNETSILKLSDGSTLMPNSPNEIGLMQGLLTLPFTCNDFENISAITHFDRDPRTGEVLNFKGETKAYIQSDPGWGTWDTHNGTDFVVPSNTFEVASTYGVMANDFVNPDNSAKVARLENTNISDVEGYFLVLLYGHHSSALIKDIPVTYNGGKGPRVYRGQIILLSGMTGTQGPHLHLTYAGNSLPGYPEGFEALDPFGAEYPTESKQDQKSMWSVFNTPVCP